MAYRIPDIVRPELLPGEQVRWTGTPSFRAVLLHGLPSMVFGLGFAVAPMAAGIPLAFRPA